MWPVVIILDKMGVGIFPAMVIHSGGGGCCYGRLAGLLVSGSPAGHGQVLWLPGELPSLPNVTLISAVVPMLSPYLISSSY